MLQQSKNEYTKTTLDPLFLPQLFGAINPKKPEVFQFQLPSINQVYGISIPYVFPPEF